MAERNERFKDWQQAAKEKLEEIDKQLGLKDRLGESAKTLKETAQKSADAVKEGAQKIKAEAERSEVGKQAAKIAEETAAALRKGGPVPPRPRRAAGQGTMSRATPNCRSRRTVRWSAVFVSASSRFRKSTEGSAK